MPANYEYALISKKETWIPINIDEYNSPYTLRPPLGPRKCGLILQVALK